MRKYFTLALVLFRATAGALQEELGKEEGEDEGWTRPAIVKALLAHIENVALNCSLTMIDSRYPKIYPNGRGSSHQFVVGCLPTTAADLNDRNYLWQLQQVYSEVNLTQLVLAVAENYCRLNMTPTP